MEVTIKNKSFMFSGLTEFSRDQAESVVQANGGVVLTSVTEKLNYLVAGDDAEKDVAQAKKLKSVVIMSEQEIWL